jgi:choline dehydrogenase-like flavoprotein
MAEDGRDIADILIIGGGTAGGVVATYLAEKGFNIVCLEQGNWPDVDSMPGMKSEFELLASREWHPSPNVRQLPEDYPCNSSESDVIPFMYNAVGGTSVLYAACWKRMTPSDFRVHSLDGVADDWPLTYEDLLPFYEEIDVEMGVSGLGGDPAYPPSAPPPLPPHSINKTGRKMAEAMNRLGWHWWPGAVAIPSTPHGSLNQCTRLGICRLGCPEGAKASTDVSHWPLAVNFGVKLITGARVAQITLDKKGLANGAVYIDRSGAQRLQRASVVILAANGIGTPRLLLLSASNSFPDGLANSSGLVGKRLMIHPWATACGVFEEDLQDWVGPAGQQIESMQFYNTETSRGFVRGAKWALMPGGGPMSHVDRYNKSGGYDRFGNDAWGAAFHDNMSSGIGHTVEWVIMPDDLPEEHNQVTLDPDLKDSDGLPGAKVNYRTSANTRRLLDFNLERCLDLLRFAGASKVWVDERDKSSGHNMGTARMGSDPKTSVVDEYGRCHDVKNLYIVDGSVFVTASGVNATATICALARRTAHYIASNARNQAVAS